MSLSEAVSEVRRQARAGVPFERIEAFVEAQYQLDEEERAVLWLIAWFTEEMSLATYELGRVSMEA